MNQLNKKACFPYTYGDNVKNDDQRLSNYITNKLSDPRIQQHMKSMAIALLALGSQARPVDAIPPEYGEAAANALKDIPQQSVPGANGKIPQNPADINQFNQKVAETLGIQEPKVGSYNNAAASKEPFALYFPGPPESVVGKTANSVALLISVGVICANGVWGNSWAAAICAGALFKAAENLMKSMRK